MNDAKLDYIRKNVPNKYRNYSHVGRNIQKEISMYKTTPDSAIGSIILSPQKSLFCSGNFTDCNKLMAFQFGHILNKIKFDTKPIYMIWKDEHSFLSLARDLLLTEDNLKKMIDNSGYLHLFISGFMSVTHNSYTMSWLVGVLRIIDAYGGKITIVSQEKLDILDKKYYIINKDIKELYKELKMLINNTCNVMEIKE